MSAKKSAKKVADAPKTDKKCDEKCKCCECKCGEKGNQSQVPFYLLIGMLVAAMVVLVVSVSFNISVRDIFRPSTYMYNGKFDKELQGDKKDENGIRVLSAGAVIDMVKNKKGFLIVGEENDISSDAFARRVGNLVDGDLDALGLFRFNITADDNDSARAKDMLGVESAPAFLYIKNGEVYDRIDDVKDEDLLKVFLSKYWPTENN